MSCRVVSRSTLEEAAASRADFQQIKLLPARDVRCAHTLSLTLNKMEASRCR